MDSRLIFLHLMISETVGTQDESVSRERKDRSRKGERNLVVKHMDVLPRKATIVYYQPVP